MATVERAARRSGPRGRATSNPAVIGLVTIVALMALAMAVPWITGWSVHAESFAPLHSIWRPRFGVETLPAVVLAVLAVSTAWRVTDVAGWTRLLAMAYFCGAAWLTTLAAADGWGGIGDVLGRSNEYLQTARSVTSVSETLRTFVGRIPLSSPDNWVTHVAGHPPGALLFFVALVRVGLGSGLAAGLVVVAIAATTPVAVMITMERLGAESAARRVAPLLVFGPSAIWSAVSADAVFASCAAWGLCCLAIAATTPSRGPAALWALISGMLLGYCLLLSYGLALLAALAAAVLVAARRARPLPWAALGAAGVVLGFAAAGFVWWEALPVLRTRYYDGIAAIRPASYWVWGDLATLGFSAGPLVGASVATSLAGAQALARRSCDDAQRCVVLLTGAAAVSIALADLSFMSKAETERIWLPFVPWLLVGCALLPQRWRRRGLAGQVTLALLLQTLLYTRW